MDDYYTRGEKEFLLKIARQTLEGHLMRGEKLEPQTVNQKLWEKRGVFVSFYREDELRGCIGVIEPVESLIVSVRDNALAAGRDPRFAPVKEAELEGLKIEISVLTPPEKTTLNKIKDGDGVVVKQGGKSATYLPQVWENVAGRDEFFGSLCEKDGLAKDCYKDGEVEFSKYEAIVFKEGEI